MSINKAVISGNLTRDAELRSTNTTGTSVLNFSVAVNDRRQNKQTGEWEDYPNYIDCTVFGKRAEALEKMLKKGTKVAVEGKLRQSSWTDKETGKKHSSVSITVDECELMTRRDGNGGGGYAGGGNDDAPSAAPADSYDENDDVPF